MCTYYCMIYAPGMYPGAEAHYDSSTLATCLWRAIFCDCLACGIFFGGGGVSYAFVVLRFLTSEHEPVIDCFRAFAFPLLGLLPVTASAFA